MESYFTLFKIVCSATRLMMLQRLVQRPHTVTELSEYLGLTPQAILKHLNTLERQKLVSALSANKKDEGIVKVLYGLAKPVNIEVSYEDGVNSIFLHIPEEDHNMKSRINIDSNIVKNEILHLIENINDDVRLLNRKLRSIRDREKRIIRELFDLERYMSEVMHHARCTTYEQTILRTYILPKPEEELKKLSHSLKISEKKIVYIARQLGVDLAPFYS